jgi:hypothetical protein
VATETDGFTAAHRPENPAFSPNELGASTGVIKQPRSALKLMKSTVRPAATFHSIVAFPFVIPPAPASRRSEAEGSAVPRTFPGEKYGFSPQQNCHPDRSVAEWRDPRFSFGSLTTVHSEADQQDNLEPLRLNGLQSKIRSTALHSSQSCA